PAQRRSMAKDERRRSRALALPRQQSSSAAAIAARFPSVTEGAHAEGPRHYTSAGVGIGFDEQLRPKGAAQRRASLLLRLGLGGNCQTGRRDSLVIVSFDK